MIISCYILLSVIFRNRFHAAAIDSDSNALKKALMGLGELGLLGLRVPLTVGGLEVEETFTPSRASGDTLSLSIPANSTSERRCHARSKSERVS